MCCHLCRLEVPPGEAHDDTPMHRAAQLIAVTALDRVRSQAFPDTEGKGVFVFEVPSSPNPGPTQPQAVPTTTFPFGITGPPTFSLGITNSPTKEPNSTSPFATNIASGDCATTNTPGTKPFGMPIAIPSFKCPVFGATLGGGPQTTGTALVKYNTVCGTDEVFRSFSSEIVKVKYHSISFMKEYENKSFEELRWEDANRILQSGHLHDFGVFKRFSVNDFEWCDYCQQLVAARAHVAHHRSKLHIDAAYQDQMFMEAVRGYVDEEDLKILEGTSTDGDHLDPYIPGSKLDKVYNCGTCGAHFVPVEFKKQHQDSIRHRACLALTAAACLRLRRHLAAGGPGVTCGDPAHTPGAPDAPGAYSDAPAPRTTTMRDLLYAYRYPPNRIKNNPQPLQPHLAPKKYINSISTRMERIGTGTAEPHGSYTMIVTDESVIIKTAVIMAVDWPMYLGVRAHGDGDYTECCACGGIYKSIEGHLETAKHVKYVLSPIDEQGIRQIDSTDSMCLLCGDKIWSFDVDAHINKERHIKNRAIALTRGNMYTEAKEDLKLHLILKTGTIKIVSEESTGEKPESEVIRNGDETIGGDQGTVKTEAGDHALPSDTTKPSTTE